MTAKSLIQHDDKNCRGDPHNVILVGTKLDIADLDESKRAVTFEEALELATSLNLSGVIETSSKDCEKTVGMQEDLNDCFSMSAINCYDISVAKHKAKMMAQNQISPQKGTGPKSNRTFFYGGQAGIVGTRAGV